MKKTLAVLLENILERTKKLEKSVSWLNNITSINVTSKLNRDLLELQASLNRPAKAGVLTAEGEYCLNCSPFFSAYFLKLYFYLNAFISSWQVYGWDLSDVVLMTKIINLFFHFTSLVNSVNSTYEY